MSYNEYCNACGGSLKNPSWIYCERKNCQSARRVRQNEKRIKSINENGGSHTKDDWEELKSKYNYKCLMCGKSEPEIKLTKDHIKPLLSGGGNEINNIQPLCSICNLKKGSNNIDFR